MQDAVLSQFEREAHEAGSWFVGELLRSVDDDSSEKFIKDYMSSKLYNDLTTAEQSRVGRLLDINEMSHWLYGRPLVGQADDELFPTEKHRAVRPVDLMGRYVLSGVMGEGIAHESPHLMERAGQLARTPLERAIALGGAALTRYGQEWGDATSGSRWTHLFQETYADGRATELFIGDNAHGDFKTEKLIYESDFVADTVYRSMRHWYAPVLEQEQAAAYHTSEPHVAAALLTHLVRDVGMDASEVYEKVVQEISLRKYESQRPGPFADYGMRDGAWAEALFRGALESERYSELTSLLISPGSEDRLVMRTVSGGVEFASLGNTMKLKTSEIPEYISFLARGASGRASPATILRIVEVLWSL